MNPSQQQDLVAKVITIGSSNVGKTSLTNCFCDKKFQDSYLTTVGIETKSKIVEINKDKITIQIWDTSGQERFAKITSNYYKNAMGVVLTYAVNNRDSFEKVAFWMEQVKTYAKEDICTVLVGTKIDLSDRCVTYDEGRKMAGDYGIRFFETSAKESINVDDAFYNLAKEIKDKYMQHLVRSSTLTQSRRDITDGALKLSSVRFKRDDTKCCY